MKRTTITRHGRTFTVLELETPAKRTTKKPPHAKFVKVPEFWIKKLVGESVSVHDLALLILVLDFEHFKRPVKLSDVAMQHLKAGAGDKEASLAPVGQAGSDFGGVQAGGCTIGDGHPMHHWLTGHPVDGWCIDAPLVDTLGPFLLLFLIFFLVEIYKL
jgi:hypothetical protein